MKGLYVTYAQFPGQPLSQRVFVCGIADEYLCRTTTDAVEIQQAFGVVLENDLAFVHFFEGMIELQREIVEIAPIQDGFDSRLVLIHTQPLDDRRHRDRPEHLVRSKPHELYGGYQTPVRVRKYPIGQIRPAYVEDSGLALVEFKREIAIVAIRDRYVFDSESVKVRHLFDPLPRVVIGVGAC